MCRFTWPLFFTHFLRGNGLIFDSISTFLWYLAVTSVSASVEGHRKWDLFGRWLQSSAWFNSGYTLTRQSTESLAGVKLDGISGKNAAFSDSVHLDIESQERRPRWPTVLGCRGLGGGGDVGSLTPRRSATLMAHGCGGAEKHIVVSVLSEPPPPPPVVFCPRATTFCELHSCTETPAVAPWSVTALATVGARPVVGGSGAIAHYCGMSG